MQRKNLVALMLVGILLATVVFAPVPGRTLGIRTLHDFAHAPVFGCIALLTLFASGAHPKFSRLALWKRYSGAFLIAITLGALTEIAQIPAGRDTSWVDLRSDVLGAGGFLGLYAAFDTGVRRATIRAIGAVAGASLLAVHCLPLAQVTNAYMHREQAFPVLADFTQQLDTYFIAAQWAALDLQALPEQWANRPGELAMRVTFEEGPWPGVDFAEPAPDWRGYTNLAIDITNPSGAELVLGLRVHDAHHDNRYEDRFNRTLNVPPLTRTILRIPIADIHTGPQTRAMDLKQIADYLLFRSGRSAAREMYVGRVWLE